MSYQPARMPGDGPVADLSKAPLPSKLTLQARQNLIAQLWRFIVINLRMLRMVRKGHH